MKFRLNVKSIDTITLETSQEDFVSSVDTSPGGVVSLLSLQKALCDYLEASHEGRETSFTILYFNVCEHLSGTVYTFAAASDDDSVEIVGTCTLTLL